jgi:L-iditol 2-dehydrogenase
MREKIAWPVKNLFPLPGSMNELDGVMLEPLGIAIHSVDLGHIKPGISVGIFGCGPIGLLVIQLSRLMGATPIIATDRLTHRLDAARSFGATYTYQVEANERDDEILSTINDEGLDVVVEAAGENAAVETAVAVARPGAQVVLAGIPADDRISFSASISRRKGLTFRIVRRMKHTYPRAIRLVENGLVDVRSLVSHSFPMEDYDQAFTTASRREGIKIAIRP